MSLPRERELKLSVSPSFRMPAFDALGQGVEAIAHEPERYMATYYDTEDLRLARSRITLRHRTNDDWTLKLPAENGSGFLLRTELRFGGSPRRLPESLEDLVRAYTRGAVLGPAARLRTVRKAVDLCDADGAVIAQVVDDEVSVFEGRRIATRFREVEIEVADNAPTRFVKRLRSVLEEAGAGPVEETPKVFRALGARALEPPDVVVSAPDRDSSAGTVVRQAIAMSVTRLLQHDPVVRLDAHIEGVHQARVATRRLRSDLRTFAPLLDEEWSRSLQTELGWLAELLGRVRDRDVMLVRMEERIRVLPESNRRAARPVLRSLKSGRRSAYVSLLEAMRGDRYISLLDRLVEASLAPQLTSRADGPAREVLREMVQRPWRSLRRRVGTLDDPPADQGPAQRAHPRQTLPLCGGGRRAGARQTCIRVRGGRSRTAGRPR